MPTDPKTKKADPAKPDPRPEVVSIIGELLEWVRAHFYRDCPQKWFPQQAMIKEALTFPSWWLDKRQVPLSAARYKEIVLGILQTILAKGELAHVAYISRYVYVCIQRHMEHQGEAYYQEGKTIRNSTSLLMSAVERAQVIPILAKAHVEAKAQAVLAVGKRKGKIKPVAPALQPDLFAPATPRK